MNILLRFTFCYEMNEYSILLSNPFITVGTHDIAYKEGNVIGNNKLI